MQPAGIKDRSDILRRTVKRLLGRGVDVGAVHATGDAGRGAKLELLGRWIETSAKMVQARTEEEVRGLLSGFLRGELGATQVAFLPAQIADPKSEISELKLEQMNEVVRVSIPKDRHWSPQETELARTAAAMTDAVLVSLAAVKAAEMQSMTDPLTGIYNRRGLDRMLEREVLLASRHQSALSVVVVDVDYFKQINDLHGHAVGDEILSLVASTMTQTLRRTDLAFRYGGDEFVLVLPQTNMEAAVAAMEKVRTAVASAKLGAAIKPPTLSIGIAELWTGATTAEVLRAADAAVYRAKRDSRDCIRTAA